MLVAVGVLELVGLAVIFGVIGLHRDRTERSRAPSSVAIPALAQSAAGVNRLSFWGPSGRSTLALFPTPTPASEPAKLVSDGRGGVWFSEQSTDIVGHLTQGRRFVEYRIPTRRGQPFALAVGADGTVWFTELGAGKIGHIDDAGRVVEFSLHNAKAQPYALSRGPDGRMWFTEYGAGKVGAIDGDGRLTEYRLPGADPAPAGIASAGGSLWVTESRYGASSLAKVTVSGGVHEYPFPSGEAQPFGIVASGEVLWIAELDGRIARVDLSGRVSEYRVPGRGPTPLDLAMSHGAVWFTETADGEIGKLTLRHGRASIVEYPLPDRAAALGLAAGPRRTLWITAYMLGSIGAFVPAGS
jgi:virginiamycin B lyase